jgi:ribosome-associated protein
VKKAKAAKTKAKKVVRAVVKAKKTAKRPVKKASVKKTVAKKKPAKKTSAKKAVARKSVKRKVVAKKKVADKIAKPIVAVASFSTPTYAPLVQSVIKRLDDAKAENVIVIDLVERSTIADTMVIASGRSDRHVNAIADQVVETLEKSGLKNLRIEGKPQCDWVLVDSGDIIVHVFRPEVRSFYNLEKLWSRQAPSDKSV